MANNGVIRQAAAQPVELDLTRRHQPPSDCTCDGFHTDAADVSVSNATLHVLVEMERCPAERRALLRIIARRG